MAGEVLSVPQTKEAVFQTVEKKLNTRAQKDGELRMTVPMLYLEATKPPRSRQSRRAKEQTFR